jgi:small conductance mechanosensitive channel
LSKAERISRLQRLIDETQKQLDDLRAKINDPKSEYRKAETEFTELDRKCEDKRRESQKLKDAGDSQQAAAVDSDLFDIEKRRTLVRERFDLAIKEQKGFQEQITTLEEMYQHDQDALNKLLGLQSPKPATSPSAVSATQPPAPTPADAASQPASPEAAVRPALALPAPVVTLPTADGPVPDATIPPATGAAATPDKKLVKAQEEATTKQAAAEEAKQQAVSLTGRLESILKAIDNERELLKTAKQKADNARETLQSLNADLEKKWVEGSTWVQLKDLRQQITEAEKRVSDTEAEIRERSERIDLRQSELSGLQTEQIAALREAQAKTQDAAAAVMKVAELKNPYRLQNILQWLIDHGPRIVFTLIATVILLWLSKVLEHRLVALLARHGVTGSHEDRENRARTLIGVFRNATTVLVVAGAFLTIVAEFGVNIVPLVGAAGVVGLAFAFGAQNLIRDYFSGFMILMENQYRMNDVVKIGEITGQVERITLRITVLRDIRGTVHFVPHGQISTVSNLTHGWSRVFFEIGVAYKEDVDHVMKVLMDLARVMRRDSEFGDLILDEPEMLGVNAFDDSAVKICFVVKTRPLKRWVVKRELNRRIKKKFDELGIEIPFPHRTVFQHIVSDVNSAPTLREKAAEKTAPTPISSLPAPE